MISSTKYTNEEVNGLETPGRHEVPSVSTSETGSIPLSSEFPSTFSGGTWLTKLQNTNMTFEKLCPNLSKAELIFLIGTMAHLTGFSNRPSIYGKKAMTPASCFPFC